VYDPEEGDDVWQIPPGTPFEELPDNWTCPVCEAPKNKFIRLGDADA
jgi:rubredoxin